MSNENVINRKATNVTLRDGNVYAIEPLTLNELIKVWPLIQRLEKQSDSMSEELIKDMIEVADVALKGKVDKAVVGDLVDLSHLKDIVTALVGVA
jgi:hypothetical protein